MNWGGRMRNWRKRSWTCTSSMTPLTLEKKAVTAFARWHPHAKSRARASRIFIILIYINLYKEDKRGNRENKSACWWLTVHLCCGFVTCQTISPIVLWCVSCFKCVCKRVCVYVCITECTCVWHTPLSPLRSSPLLSSFFLLSIRPPLLQCCWSYRPENVSPNLEQTEGERQSQVLLPSFPV